MRYAALLIATSTMFVASAMMPLRAAGTGAKLYGDAARGNAILDKWCVSCHRRGPATDDRTPSLTIIAAGLPSSEPHIRAFLMQPHKPMPPLVLSGQEIEDIIAAIKDLKNPAER